MTGRAGEFRVGVGDITVRRLSAEDASALHAINEAAVPGVNSIPAAAFPELLASADEVFVAIREGRPLGFVLCMTEGLDYDSANYRWLSDRYDAFAYVDRIAVSSEARGGGAGRALYEAAVARYRGHRKVLLAEVNLAPANPGSVRFHERHGFRRIGERWSEGGDKGVVYFERTL